MSTTERTDDAGWVTVYCCPEHAPIGIAAESNDDGYCRCVECGKSGYHVKPFILKESVALRGWRMENYQVSKGGKR